MVVGLGRMGGCHIKAYKNLQIQTVVGADIREEAVSSYQNTYPEHVFSADWRSLLNETRPDIMSIATNGPSHAEIVIEAARLNIPYILCEKPLTTSIEKADEMIATCNSHGTRLFVNFSLRFFPAFQRLQSLIALHTFGNIRSIHVTVGGAGGLGCIGSHYVDLIQLVMGSEPVRVWGALDSKQTPNPRGSQFRDPGGFGMYTLANGARAFLEMSEDFPQPLTFSTLITIIGDRARAIIDVRHNRWMLEEYGSETIQPIAFDASGQADLVSATTLTIKDMLSNGGRTATGADGIRALHMILGIHASHARGNIPVAIPLVQDDRMLDVPMT